MSSNAERYVTVLAVAVLVLSVPLTWQVADVRAGGTSEKVEPASAQPVAARQAPADYDGDGVDDSADRCPTRPETRNGFQDDDGCPDVVATTGAS